MRLYSYWRSSCSWRVRIGLALKGLKYEYVAVHLRQGEQTAAQHKQRSPLGQVPVLQLTNSSGSEVLVTQSLAILQLLDDLHPEPALVPRDDPFARCRMWELAELINAGIQPMQNLGILQAVKGLGADPKEWASRYIKSGLTAVESMKKKTAGGFLVGNSPTVADCCLIPQLYNARRFGIDMTQFPELLQVETACTELDAFAQAHPDRQPDAEQDAPA